MIRTIDSTAYPSNSQYNFDPESAQRKKKVLPRQAKNISTIVITALLY